MAGTNYVSTSGVLTLEPGQFFSQIVVPLLPGTVTQPERIFSVTLSAPGGASVGPIGSYQVEVSHLRLVVSQPVGDVVAGSTFDLDFGAEDALGNVATELDGPMSFLLTNAVGDGFGSSGTFVDGVADIGPTTIAATGTYKASVTTGPVTITTPDAVTVVPVGTSSTTPPVTVMSVRWETIMVKVGEGKIAKRMSKTALEIQFSGLVSGSGDLAAYHLASVVTKKVKKQTVTSFKPIRLSSALPASSRMASSVVLVLATNPNLSRTDRLLIVASDLTDALGRRLDGDDDGRPGGDYTAAFSQAGVSADEFSRLEPAKNRTLFQTRWTPYLLAVS